MGSAKVPPRFVPTLTDVVPVHPETAPAPGPQPGDGADGDDGMPLPAQWAREGMLAPRRGVVSLPESLPPLPPDLAPQPALPDELQPAGDEAAAVHDAVPVPQAQAPQAPWPQAAHADAPQPAMASSPPASASSPPASASMAQAMDGLWETHAQKITEEYLVHRLMQRVDLVLDQRLREAIATVVQEQTRSIVVRLREEVESVVRQAVYEAVADELAQQARTARGP